MVMYSLSQSHDKNAHVSFYKYLHTHCTYVHVVYDFTDSASTPAGMNFFSSVMACSIPSASLECFTRYRGRIHLSPHTHTHTHTWRYEDDTYLLLIDNGDNLSLDVLAEHRARHQTSFLQHTAQHTCRQDRRRPVSQNWKQIENCTCTFISPISASSLHAEA